jgi:hypothetical protein
MEEFNSAFSFTLGVVFALALFPTLLVIMTVGLPNAIMGVVTATTSTEWKVRKWNRAVARGDRGQIDFLRKWGYDKLSVSS